MLKIYLEKKNEVTKISAKYQTLLDKYSDKCKELDKLTNEHKVLCLKKEELQNKTKTLEQECSKAKSNYAAIEKTYNIHVNSTACKYQATSQSLADMTKKYQLEAKRVTKLQATINDLKNKLVKSPRSPEKVRRRVKTK